MLFSHISDTHLGLQQYGLEEREQDIYDSFNQAIDISIKDHVEFVIFAGDIFHTPNPSGTAILQMANALKKLKENSIDSFFILGEHDISRMRATPVPYVYHNLQFSKYVGNGKPVYHKDVMIAGFDKKLSELKNAEFVIHPECSCTTPMMYDIAAGSYKNHQVQILSTEGMMNHVSKSDSQQFVVATETGILYRMKQQNPQKTFIPASENAECEYMKMITLDKVYRSLYDEKYEVKVPKKIAEKASLAIERMLSIS